MFPTGEVHLANPPFVLGKDVEQSAHHAGLDGVVLVVPDLAGVGIVDEGVEAATVAVHVAGSA